MVINRNITYAVYDGDDGTYTVSRVGSELAWPVLDFAGIGMGGLERSTGAVYAAGDFRGPTNYDLGKVSVYGCPSWTSLRWTKKIHLNDKNRHRAFWGLKPLKPTLPNDHEVAVRNSLPSDFDRCVYDIKNGLNGMPHIYTWQQVARYLNIEPGAVKTALKLIKERM